MTKDGRPFLRVNNNYLTIMYHDETGRQRAMRSFGRADKPENWDNATSVLLDYLRQYYKKIAHSYLTEVAKNCQATDLNTNLNAQSADNSSLEL